MGLSLRNEEPPRGNAVNKIIIIIIMMMMMMMMITITITIIIMIIIVRPWSYYYYYYYYLFIYLFVSFFRFYTCEVLTPVFLVCYICTLNQYTGFATFLPCFPNLHSWNTQPEKHKVGKRLSLHTTKVAHQA